MTSRNAYIKLRRVTRRLRYLGRLSLELLDRIYAAWLGVADFLKTALVIAVVVSIHALVYYSTGSLFYLAATGVFFSSFLLAGGEILAFWLCVGLSIFVFVFGGSSGFAYFCLLVPTCAYILGSRTRLFSRLEHDMELIYYVTAIVGIVLIFLSTQVDRRVLEIERETTRLDEQLLELKKYGFLGSKEDAKRVVEILLVRSMHQTLLTEAYRKCPSGYLSPDASTPKTYSSDKVNRELFDWFQPTFLKVSRLSCSQGELEKNPATDRAEFEEWPTAIVEDADLLCKRLLSAPENVGLTKWLFTDACTSMVDFDNVWTSKVTEAGVLNRQKDALAAERSALSTNKSQSDTAYFVRIFEKVWWHYLLVLAVSLKLFSVGRKRIQLVGRV